MSAPSGFQAYCSTPLAASVICRASPPRMSSTNTCGAALSPEPAVARNARRSPLGDQRGEPTPLRSKVSLRCVPLAMSRSEEHTSELQSRLHLVCRLLLEKKKKQSH